jgi:hypothetical protein
MNQKVLCVYEICYMKRCDSDMAWFLPVFSINIQCPNSSIGFDFF